MTRDKFLFVFIFFIFSSSAQELNILYKSNWIEVENQLNNSSIPNAWAGGINACLINTLSLNGDDLEDLYIFDRTSERSMFFTALEEDGSIYYEYAPEFESILPEINDWVLLRDYNCDGRKDIFTYRPGGIRVFKNTSSGIVPQFQLEEEIVLSIYDYYDPDPLEDPGPTTANIFVSSIDIPSIDDFDGDGDLDVHTFALNVSGVVEYHQNMSVENFGICDSLHFELANQCYGYFIESSVSPEISLGDTTCPVNVENPRSFVKSGGLHAGSTICAFDYDQNGFKDLLIGDITADSLALLYNGPSALGPDSIFQIDTRFPSDGIPVDMHTFLSSFYEDVNNDGINDLVVTVNKENGIEDIENVLLYTNTGLNDLPNFQFTQNDFVSESMIDIGTNSYPHFFDHNADGLMDLILSNRGLYQTTSSEYQSSLYLFENTGTQTDPIFTLIDEDYASLSQLSLGESLYPTFGDLDGDGDEDMILGNKDGKHHFFRNTAGAGNTANFEIGQLQISGSDGEDLDPGQWVTPQLFDIDDDNDLDLFVGERNGNVNYYENIGTNSNFNFELVKDSVGNFHVDSDGDTVGNSVPFLFKNSGNTEMLVANNEGSILHYDGISSNLNGDFNLIDGNLYGLHLGTFGSLAMFDINDDGKYDLITGNESGGVQFYGSFVVNIEEIQEKAENRILLYPNPAQNEIIIESLANSIDRVEIYSIDGKRLYHEPYKSPGIIDISALAEGIYIVRLQLGTEQVLKRFIKQ
ncbi:MAG: T9SS type A sorting domain-containing protein [Bacteroidota bacterium]